VNQHSR